LPGRLSRDCFSTLWPPHIPEPVIASHSPDRARRRRGNLFICQPSGPHSWGEIKRVGGHPQSLGSILLHLSYVIPAELVLVETGSRNPVVKRVERNKTADTVSRLLFNPLDPPLSSQPVFARSRRRRGNLGEGRLLRLPARRARRMARNDK
jgi:hypothetical protein